jgi:RNA polymerase sigma-70 factor, ECF subfamily
LDLSSLDDAALLTLIAAAYRKPASDSRLNDAVAALYDRYGRLVYSIAFHSAGEIETAQEITQDVFVRACANAHTYQPGKARVSSWLVSIARHRVIDELRRRRYRPEIVLMELSEDASPESLPGLPLPGNPEEMLEMVEEQRRIRNAVAELPREQRVVLALAFFKGLSHSQIAELLGEPLGTVKSRVRLAMQKLRDRLVELAIIE